MLLNEVFHRRIDAQQNLTGRTTELAWTHNVICMDTT